MKLSSQSLLVSVGVIAILTLSWGAGLFGVPYQMETHRIGVCDVQIVLDQIPQGKAITEEFNALRASMENQLRSLEAD
ncbi:MAG: hypothetical protein ACPG1Z_06695, partial [Planctomycetota bacterium]